MFEEASHIPEMIFGLDYNAFMNDTTKKYAICMVLVNVGELANKLSDDFRNEHSALPLAQMRKTRNVIAHDYDQIKWPLIRGIATQDVPVLLPELERILKEYEAKEGPFDFESNHNNNLRLIARADKTFDDDSENVK
ncbi:MAG: DUF86 domain-containing protein [Synergistaceae bacterium]|jgi:uncharacterized protein with HEPN domain|nr:DUF86 domain-containing protein [Synergistaceae bacterium]